MAETLLSLDSPLYVKDPVRVPLPAPRGGGLTRLLRTLDIGESATVPRRCGDDISKVGAALNRTFTTRVLDETRSRVWRVA
jgi:hypothetical protein